MSETPEHSASNQEIGVNRRDFVKMAGASAAAAALASFAPTGGAEAAGGLQSLLTQAFIRTIQRARLFDLSHDWPEHRRSPA